MTGHRLVRDINEISPQSPPPEAERLRAALTETFAAEEQTRRPLTATE
jgi:hypothetical protein